MSILRVFFNTVSCQLRVLQRSAGSIKDAIFVYGRLDGSKRYTENLMKIAFQLLMLTMLLHASLSSAALYRWVDEKGVTHYTSAPPPESAVSDRDVLNERGRVLKTIQGRMTPEEKAAYEKKLFDEDVAAKVLAKQQKRDRNLLISYKTEQELIDKRDAKLATLDDYIESLEESREASSYEYEELLNTAILKEREGKAPSEKLKANLRSAKRELEDHKANLKKAKKERLKTDTVFEEDIRRFRELKNL